MNHVGSACIRLVLLCSVLVLGLAACAGVPAVDWEHGARRGTIVAIIDDDAPAASLPPCLAALSREARAGRQFVSVRRFRLRGARIEIAEVAAGVPTAPGTAVEVFPGDCTAGKLARVTRTLAVQ